MKRKLNKLLSLFAGVGVLSSSTSALDFDKNSDQKYDFLDDVDTANLNTAELPMYLATHRSHSSHSSHSSHRSSSGGGYSTPKREPSPSRPSPSYTPPSEPLSQPSRPSSSIPSVAQNNFEAAMSDQEKRKNIILRLQVTLEALGFYSGSLDGVMGPELRKGLNDYRKSVGLPLSDKIDLNVLNSLGILIL